ncbi:MAG: ATP synthase F1 subunit delta [Eubacteriales bacterium]|nr:ATP synthase F1 subunit delta [Eubacteriales bacterium]
MTNTARIYGGSLYDLAAEEQQTEAILEQMTEIRSVFRENPDYLRLLSEPSIPLEERRKLIEEAFGSGAHRYLVNLLKLMCDRNILREFAGCCEEYTRRYRVDNHIAEAVVTSAVLLTDEQKKALKESLEKKSGKQISLICKVDPKVVAGLRVNLEGTSFDGTVRGRLEGISRKLDEIIV